MNRRSQGSMRTFPSHARPKRRSQIARRSPFTVRMQRSPGFLAILRHRQSRHCSHRDGARLGICDSVPATSLNVCQFFKHVYTEITPTRSYRHQWLYAGSPQEYSQFMNTCELQISIRRAAMAQYFDVLRSAPARMSLNPLRSFRATRSVENLVEGLASCNPETPVGTACIEQHARKAAGRGGRSDLTRMRRIDRMPRRNDPRSRKRCK